jgi:hypothetical protein
MTQETSRAGAIQPAISGSLRSYIGTEFPIAFSSILGFGSVGGGDFTATQTSDPTG